MPIRVRTRYRNLEKLGTSHSNAGILANSRKGYWRIAGSPILNAALSNERLEKNGFQYFFSYYKSVNCTEEKLFIYKMLGFC